MLRVCFWTGLAVAGAGLVWTHVSMKAFGDLPEPRVERPAFGNLHWRARPQLLIDEAHGNHGTIETGLRAFAMLAEADGYRPAANRLRFNPENLRCVRVLVIARPAGPLEPGETAALQAWLNDGGSLLWIGEAQAALKGRVAAVAAPPADLALLHRLTGVE